MKFILTLLLLTLFVDASYIRSIRVTSFLNKAKAEKELSKLKQFVKSHKNLKNLKKRLSFEYTIHKIDKNYLLVLEPLTDKKAVQEILDTLRTKYKKAYPRKLKSMPAVFPKIEKKFFQFAPEAEIMVEQIKPKVIPAKKKVREIPKEKTPPLLHDNIIQVRNNSDINSSNEGISALLIFILALLLIISFFYIYFSRKKKRSHSKTLTEIVIDNKDELQLKEQIAPIAFEDDERIILSTLPNYEELNTKVGLNSYSNELETYRNALKDFKEKQLDSAISIEQLCNNSDFNQALKLVQILKEESIQIGAFNLHESIKKLEQEIELGENAQWEKSIWAYGITFKNLSAEIDHYLKH